jgi:protocatechuate 3,4-dioxygenase beta subunit
MPNTKSRRQLLILAAGTAASSIVPAWALERTPPMTEGPFYPRAADLPLDDDNDLTRVKGKDGVASGTLLDLAGRIVDTAGNAVANANVEIWQCNSHGRYHDARDESSSPRDAYFQGFGKTLTDTEGRFRFRTIRPVAYPGRAPHIHFKVKAKPFKELTTQMFVAGDAALERDSIWRSLRNAELKKQMAIELRPAEANSGASLTGYFEIMIA